MASKTKNIILIATAIIISIGSSFGKTNKSYKIIDGIIEFNEPVREKGQKSVLGLRTAPMDTVRVGFIGLGMRGPGAVERFTHIDSIKVVALCDLYPDRIEKSQNILDNAGLPRAATYSGEEGWKELCQRDDIDLVYIATPWLHHTPMAVYAMEHGKHVAVEVPAAMSIEECWKLVDTAERMQRHCMMLENCVYDLFELTTLNMAQQGVFGDIIYAEGAYIHNLDDFWTSYQGNWRLDYNQKNRGDNYPTHGIGPICQALNIHRGDKMNYLVSMDTKSINGLATAKKIMKVDKFADGDHTVTLIRTNNNKMMQIQHNVYTPRPYNRLYQLTGTEGFANKYPIEGYVVGKEITNKNIASKYDNLEGHEFVPEAVRVELMERYKHPITKKLENIASKVGGHGGMDFIMDYRMIYCLKNGLPLDQDVYDAAEWSCLTELSGASIENGSAQVKVPDFTRGDWNKINGLKLAE
ncbi:MAG: Gfo/Idh/MocA family oxidoreductase [Bacteroidales bacterium]